MSQRKEELLLRVVVKAQEGFSSIFATMCIQLGNTVNLFKKQPGVNSIDISISTSDDVVRDATDKIIKYNKGNLPTTRDELFESIKYGFFYQKKPDKY